MQDAIFRTAPSQSHHLSLSGGSETSRYRASLGYDSQDGIIMGSGMSTFTGRLATNHAALDGNLLIDLNLMAAEIRQDNAPQNGFNTYQVVFDRYEETDARGQYILHGPQEDADGNPIPSLENPNVQLVLIPHVDYKNSAQNEGFRVMKYQIDPNWVGNQGHHDFPLLRLADVMLVRAEALLRAGAPAGGEALTLVNQVRGRSNASPLEAVTLAAIEQERARELVWEGSRRRDMIRFGTYFTGTWKFKQGVTPDHKGVYPIPANQLQGNPELRQNPGY